MQDKNIALNIPQEFFHAFHTSPKVIKIFLYELLLHNLVVPNNKDWNPLLYVGDIQL